MVPHAPLLLPEVGGDRGAAVTAAVASLDFPGAEVVVLASPHGDRTGVYRLPSGDLDAFGPRGITADAEPGPAEELARAWGRPVVEDKVDHGIVVPLRLLAPSVPVIAVAFAEGGENDDGLAYAIASLGPVVAFVASANLSPGLDERSPLPSLKGPAEADAAVLAALREAPESVVAPPASCAAPTLAAFGSLFAGRPCEVLAYEHPWGVGYAVARSGFE